MTKMIKPADGTNATSVKPQIQKCNISVTRMLKKVHAWLITYWKNREQIFFESMHCLFFDCQQTTPATTKDRRRQPPPSWQEKREQGKRHQERRRQLQLPKRKNQQAYNRMTRGTK
jgi:hypothetical protein